MVTRKVFTIKKVYFEKNVKAPGKNSHLAKKSITSSKNLISLNQIDKKDDFAKFKEKSIGRHISCKLKLG